jgi:L-ascorbate metabolism protein UlaG (beta-lactamase superfamily)
VTFVANEGFLIEGGDKKVLIDALFAKHDYYDVPSPELLARMIDGEPPFDCVDLVLATHHHADHFDASTVLAFLASHPESTFVSTPEVIEQMKSDGAGFAEVRERVRAVELSVGSSAERTLRGIPIWIYSSGHSGKPEWQNFVYAFDLGGRTFLHEGDSVLNGDGFRSFAAAGKSADLAFLHRWFMTDELGLRSVREDLKAERVLLMHIPERFHDETLEKLERIRGRFPETYWLRSSLDEMSF